MSKNIDELIKDIDQDLPTNVFTIEDKDPHVILGKLNEVIDVLKSLKVNDETKEKVNQALENSLRALDLISAINGVDGGHLATDGDIENLQTEIDNIKQALENGGNMVEIETAITNIETTITSLGERVTALEGANGATGTTHSLTLKTLSTSEVTLNEDDTIDPIGSSVKTQDAVIFNGNEAKENKYAIPDYRHIENIIIAHNNVANRVATLESNGGSSGSGVSQEEFDNLLSNKTQIRSNGYNNLLMGNAKEKLTSLTTYAVAVGGNASVHSNGVAIGHSAKTEKGSGVAIGYNSIVNSTKSIQLGTGTNNTDNSVQFFDDNIYNHNTHTLTVQNIELNGEDLASKLGNASGGGKTLKSQEFRDDTWRAFANEKLANNSLEMLTMLSTLGRNTNVTQYTLSPDTFGSTSVSASVITQNQKYYFRPVTYNTGYNTGYLHCHTYGYTYHLYTGSNTLYLSYPYYSDTSYGTKGLTYRYGSYDFSSILGEYLTITIYYWE